MRLFHMLFFAKMKLQHFFLLLLIFFTAIGGKEMLSLEQELKSNEYPGRGIVIGMSADGRNALYAYFIMGRSENSRNRVFQLFDGGGIAEGGVAHNPLALAQNIAGRNGDHQIDNGANHGIENGVGIAGHNVLVLKDLFITHKVEALGEEDNLALSDQAGLTEGIGKNQDQRIGHDGEEEKADCMNDHIEGSDLSQFSF